MRFFLFAFLITVLFSGCNENGTFFQEKAPLTEDQFIEVFEDVLVLENYYQSKYGSINNYKNALDKSCEITFKKHGVSKIEFEKSYEFYAKNSKQLRSIQETIIERLNTKKL